MEVSVGGYFGHEVFVQNPNWQLNKKYELYGNMSELVIMVSEVGSIFQLGPNRANIGILRSILIQRSKLGSDWPWADPS